mmetsp:Transcript_66051/g.214852  ORF Transcript_66051/g.214852 Transcript_66051/m.214852 type:complete len:414 (+) Transcript_66051:198-1439(+)
MTPTKVRVGEADACCTVVRTRQGGREYATSVARRTLTTPAARSSLSGLCRITSVSSRIQLHNSPSSRNGNLSQSKQGLARIPVDVNEAPPLLVEGHVRVGPRARRLTAIVVHPSAAFADLPPLVGKLEDEAANARAAGHRAVVHNLLSQGLRGNRLRLLVLSADLGVEGVRSILAQEEGLGAESSVGVKEVAEADAPVSVHTPDVDGGHASIHALQFVQLAVDTSHGMLWIIALDVLGHLLQTRHRVPKSHVSVEAIVVPLVPDGPHQDRGMVLHGIHLADDTVGRCTTVVVDAVEHPNAVGPEHIQHPGVCDRLVCAHGIDSGLGQESSITLHGLRKVHIAWIGATLLDGVPSDTLHVDRLAVDEDLPPLNLNPAPCGGSSLSTQARMLHLRFALDERRWLRQHTRCTRRCS